MLRQTLFPIVVIVFTLVLQSFPVQNALSQPPSPTPQTTSTPTPLPPLGLELEGYEYPYPVSSFPLEIDGQKVRMAYMDVAPQGTANGHTVVLLHGKNFFGAYWRDTIPALVSNGYRVIVPDQIGFGKSTKAEIPYSFHLLAANTRKLLDSLGIDKVSVVGHSMGGMLATRFALQYPDSTEHLVLANPIGLEDYRVGVPWRPLEKVTEDEAGQTEEKIRTYFKSYVPAWKPEYDEWVEPQVRLLGNEGFKQLARVNALTFDMIYQQPVVYEFPEIRVPTLLIIGQEDRTVVGKALLPPAKADEMGQYPALGRKAHEAIKGSKLCEFEGVGHLPHLEDRARFQAELLKFLKDNP